jgi:hypothetical protein
MKAARLGRNMVAFKAALQSHESVGFLLSIIRECFAQSSPSSRGTHNQLTHCYQKRTNFLKMMETRMLVCGLRKILILN